jgi:hypothetical protein
MFTVILVFPGILRSDMAGFGITAGLAWYLA